MSDDAPAPSARRRPGRKSNPTLIQQRDPSAESSEKPASGKAIKAIEKPSYETMILEAIIDLGNGKQGSSKIAIRKYIVDKYSPPHLATFLGKNLMRMIEKGTLVHPPNGPGKYAISEPAKKITPPRSGKPGRPKKTVTPEPKVTKQAQQKAEAAKTAPGKGQVSKKASQKVELAKKTLGNVAASKKAPGKGEGTAAKKAPGKEEVVAKVPEKGGRPKKVTPRQSSLNVSLPAKARGRRGRKPAN